MKLIRKMIIVIAIMGMMSVSYGAKQNNKVTAKMNKTTISHHQKININKASIKTLQTIKGIGLKKASAIVAFRQAHGGIHSVAELDQVKGISPRLAQNIAKVVTFGKLENKKVVTAVAN